MNPATPRRQLSGGRRLLLLVVGGLFVLLLIWAAWRTWTAYSAYRAVIADMAALQAVVGGGMGTLSVDTIAGIEPKIDDLSRDLRRLDAATSVPLGGEALVGQFPWIGSRYATGRTVIRIGELLADAGKSVTGIAREVLVAFQSTDASSLSPPAAATWLEVLGRHQAELEQIAMKIDEANALRAGIDERLLPAEVRAQLDSLDQMLKRFDINRVNRLLRQPRLTTAGLTVTSFGCKSPFITMLTTDVTIDLGFPCRWRATTG